MPCAKEGRRVIVAVVAASLALSGCGAKPGTPYRDYAVEPPKFAPGPNAFDDYVAAANEAERKASKYLTTTSFTPGKRQAVIDALGPALGKVSRAGAKPCQFAFEPAPPFEAPPHRGGWRLIGAALVWKIDALVETERFGEAIQPFLVATRFGFDLTGGSATDASLGFAIVDDARRALMPALLKLQARELKMLASGLDQALKRRPNLAKMVENERMSAMLAIEDLQNAYQKQEFGLYKEKIGNDAQPAIKYLSEMKARDASDRPAYFDGMAKEADAWAAYFTSLCAKNAHQRMAVDQPKFEGNRPWRRWSKYFFQAPRDVFAIQDRSVARTRLLALSADFRATWKATGAYPANLDGLASSIAIDPYSGERLVCRSDGGQFKLYSVGADFRDDGGESNESFEAPDLCLEIGRR